MTTVEKSSHACLQSPPAHVSKEEEDNHSVYDSDDGQPRDSPLLKPMRPNLEPLPSPPPAVSQVSPDSSPGRKASNRSKVRVSQGDAVLVSFMSGGKHPEIAFGAGMEPLPSDDDATEGWVEDTAEIVVRKGKRSPSVTAELTALAAGALAHAACHAQGQPAVGGKQSRTSPSGDSVVGASPQVDGEDAMNGIINSRIPSVSTNPRYTSSMSRARASSDTPIKVEASPTTVASGLPPIQAVSPQSGPNGIGTAPITLPGLRDQLGDLNQLGEPIPNADSSFSQSPQVRPPPRFTSSLAGQAIPPTPLSPTDYRRELPSPSRSVSSYYAASAYRKPSQSEGGPGYVSNADYSSGNTETPSTDQSGSTPAMGIDRMSIDGITNPQIGAFQCTYLGCTAQPFQTQYLLNSHANVHSSSRPHYCAVKGCPRAEGGKGFKRKNEMIRHGLVHDSPGYVCPFCPDREHKYPRPDNLQRHVRVHHVDKDKDDLQLREVLAQRPEGPNRGRRRRGGTN